MKQSAADRPDPTIQRKAAIVNGGVVDHAGNVTVEPMKDFDLDRTIFQTLEGALPRFVMKRRIAKEVSFHEEPARTIQQQYEATREKVDLPTVDPELINFLVEECDFDVEHAEGSFLDHLYFGFEYSVQHYPQHSPLVMLLHSILGTGTNTFAMKAEKIPQLKALISDFEWRHVEAFPSVLRLLYVGELRDELRANVHRADALQSIEMHRVIDNAPITMSGEDLWIQLNYQLMHLIDFLPVANWGAHQTDNSFLLFRDLYDILKQAGKLQANIHYTPPTGGRKVVGEKLDLGGKILTIVPAAVVAKAQAKSVRKFSERIGHSLEYRTAWS